NQKRTGADGRDNGGGLLNGVTAASSELDFPVEVAGRLDATLFDEDGVVGIPKADGEMGGPGGEVAFAAAAVEDQPGALVRRKLVETLLHFLPGEGMNPGEVPFAVV